MSYTFLSLQYKNSDGTVVVAQTEEFGAVIVTPDRVELWDQMQQSGLPIEAYAAPPPPVLTKIWRSTIWRRVTDDEAGVLDAALKAAPARLRLLFEASNFLLTTDPDWPLIEASVTGALGVERAAVVLAPEE